MLRASLLDEIRAAALDELRRAGAAALSLREVAKAAGISPSGLYRYVDGRDGLLELLISDGFESLGAAIEAAIAAAGDDVIERAEASALGYRRWAIDNPEQFGLILGTPIPGFHAREDGPTSDSVRRFANPMLRVIVDAWESRTGRTSDTERSSISASPGAEVAIEQLPESLRGPIVRGWARIHGLVALEVFGHLTWSGTNVEALLRTEVRSIVAELAQ